MSGDPKAALDAAALVARFSAEVTKSCELSPTLASSARDLAALLGADQLVICYRDTAVGPCTLRSLFEESEPPLAPAPCEREAFWQRFEGGTSVDLAACADLPDWLRALGRSRAVVVAFQGGEGSLAWLGAFFREGHAATDGTTAVLGEIANVVSNALAAQASTEAAPRPASSPESQKIAPSEAAPSGPAVRRRGRILIIDDEELTLKLLSRIFGKTYDLLVAASGAQALALLERENTQFPDLVLCDLMMPDLTGMAFFAEIETRYPKLAEKTFFLTGGAFTDEARVFVERMGARVFYKPLEVQQIRALLDERVAEGALA